MDQEPPSMIGQRRTGNTELCTLISYAHCLVYAHKPEKWDSAWPDDQIYKSILRHRKGQHLSQAQKVSKTDAEELS